MIRKETILKIKRDRVSYDNKKVLCTVRAFFGGGVSTVIKCTERDLFEIKSLKYNYEVI